MNLQENIDRIQSMMGIITEDRKETVIKNMIDSEGLDNTIKMVGDYDEVVSYLSNEEKIKYIKDKIIEIGDKFRSIGVALNAPQGRPLRIKYEDGIIHQIEFLGPSRARVESYEKPESNNNYAINHNSYVINYNDLEPQIMDIIIKRLIEM